MCVAGSCSGGGRSGKAGFLLSVEGEVVSTSQPDLHMNVLLSMLYPAIIGLSIHTEKHLGVLVGGNTFAEFTLSLLPDLSDHQRAVCTQHARGLC